MAMTDSFADKLAHLRAAKGLTQRELAAKVGIAWSMISKYESGKSKPRLKVLLSLEDALGCPGELTGRDDVISFTIPADLHARISEVASSRGMSVENLSWVMMTNYLNASHDEVFGFSPPSLMTPEQIDKARAQMGPEEYQKRRRERLIARKTRNL